MNDDIQVKLSAHDVLDSFYVRRPEDIDLDVFAADLGAPVIYEPLRNAEAILLRRGSSALVVANSQTAHQGRVRFAVAHELGHFRLHSRNSQAWLLFTDTQKTLADYKNNRLEIEANTFAAHLLMPPRMFAADVERESFSISGIERLSQRYSVSLIAAARRFVDESRDDLMVIMSEEGRVKWFHRRLKGKGCFVAPGSSVPVSSDATDCLKGESGHPDLTPVQDLSMWFPDIEPGHIVFEQSKKLGGFPWVLTLIEIQDQDEGEE